MKRRLRFLLALALGVLVLGALAVSCGEDEGENGEVSGDLQGIADARGLTPDDMKHALQSFVPPGTYDEYFMFSSGGHSGQVMVVGLPSMRILKVISVFTPEPWQGYGYGADWGDTILEEGNPAGTELAWGDTHHPAISETGGEYDGRWLYIQDRANGRVGMIDLRDLRTKQVIAVPNIQTSHGGMFVTPN